MTAANDVGSTVDAQNASAAAAAKPSADQHVGDARIASVQTGMVAGWTHATVTVTQTAELRHSQTSQWSVAMVVTMPAKWGRACAAAQPQLTTVAAATHRPDISLAAAVPQQVLLGPAGNQMSRQGQASAAPNAADAVQYDQQGQADGALASIGQAMVLGGSPGTDSRARLILIRCGGQPQHCRPADITAPPDAVVSEASVLLAGDVQRSGGWRRCSCTALW